MSAKVKETAKEEVERVRHLTEEAVRSGAYLYPLKVCQKKNQYWMITNADTLSNHRASTTF